MNLICVLLSRALGIFQFLQRIASRTLKMGAEFVLATTKHQDAIPVDRLFIPPAYGYRVAKAAQIPRRFDTLSVCLVTRQPQFQMPLCIRPFGGQHAVHHRVANSSVAARMMVP